jgi:hypothetical protein
MARLPLAGTEENMITQKEGEAEALRAKVEHAVNRYYRDRDQYFFWLFDHTGEQLSVDQKAKLYQSIIDHLEAKKSPDSFDFSPYTK